MPQKMWAGQLYTYVARAFFKITLQVFISTPPASDKIQPLLPVALPFAPSHCHLPPHVRTNTLTTPIYAPLLCLHSASLEITAFTNRRPVAPLLPHISDRYSVAPPSLVPFQPQTFCLPSPLLQFPTTFLLPPPSSAPQAPPLLLRPPNENPTFRSDHFRQHTPITTIIISATSF